MLTQCAISKAPTIGASNSGSVWHRCVWKCSHGRGITLMEISRALFASRSLASCRSANVFFYLGSGRACGPWGVSPPPPQMALYTRTGKLQAAARHQCTAQTPWIINMQRTHTLTTATPPAETESLHVYWISPPTRNPLVPAAACQPWRRHQYNSVCMLGMQHKSAAIWSTDLPLLSTNVILGVMAASSGIIIETNNPSGLIDLITTDRAVWNIPAQVWNTWQADSVCLYSIRIHSTRHKYAKAGLPRNYYGF